MTPNIKRRTAMKAAGVAALVGLASDSSRGGTADTGTLTPDRHGPMRTGRFEVQIDDVEVPGWQTVTIPSTSTEEGEYREGDEPESERRIWGQTTYDDLEMERGVFSDDARIREWRDAVIEGRVEEGLKDVTVVLQDKRGEPQIRWVFTDAWPKNYDPPTLDASADGDMATESITVAYDRMIREEV